MERPDVTFYFDFIDPLSYLLDLELTAVATPDDRVVRYAPFELRPPPTALTTPADAELVWRWREARAIADVQGVALVEPAVVPWSRKAHELRLFAASHDLGDEARTAIFAAFFASGLDIGRVDVLVGIARGLGLDTTETKAVLDVDRFEADVSASRVAAIAAGVHDAPVVIGGSDRVEGYRNRTDLSTFLRHT